MTEIEITTKSDGEILKIIKEYANQGYHVFLQKRCSDKFLMQTEYITAGVLDTSQQIIVDHDDHKQSIDSLQQMELPKTLFSRDSLVFIPRQTITDFNKILSPQVREQNDEKLQSFYEMLQKGIMYEQDGHVEQSISTFNNLITNIENDGLLVSNLVNVIYVEAILLLGLLQSRISQYQQGKKNFEKCLRLFIIKDQLLLAKIYLRLGQNCQQLFSYQKAVDYLTQALVIYEIYQLKVEISLTLSQIAIIYAHLGHHNIALQMGMQSIQQVKSLVKSDAFIIAQLYHAVGEIHYFNHDYEEAIEYFDAAYDIKTQYKKERLSQILTLNYLASSCYHLGEYKKAQQLYEISLSQITERSTLQEAQILNNLALSKMAQGESGKADLDKAIQIYMLYHSETHPSVRRALRNRKL